MPKRRRSVVGSIVLLALLALAPGKPVRAAEPLVIYAILPQTGSAAFLGKQEALSLGVVETVANKQGGIAGRPLHFVVLDDQSNPQTGVQLTNDVIAKKAQVIIGSTLASICNAQATFAKDGPVIYCFSPGIHPPPGSYVFTAGASTTDQLAVSVRYLRERGLNRVAVITTTDATGQDADQNIDLILGQPENQSMVIVDREHFGTVDMSVSAQMARVKASGAQALIIWATGTPVGTVLRGVTDIGLDIPVVTSPGNATYAEMSAFAANLPHELDFAGSASYAPESLPARSPVKVAVTAYLAAFKAAGIEPDEGYLIVWDPAWMVIDALRKLGPNATAQQIQSFITNDHDTGISGSFNFTAVPQRGLDANSLIMIRWDPAKRHWYGISKFGGTP